MPSLTRPVRLLIAAGTGILVVGGLVAGPTAQASAPSSSVTVLLKAPNQAGLDRLATAQGLSHAQRVAALASLLPSAAAHRQVTAELRDEGFTVTGQTAWTITAEAPSTAVASTFGVAPSAPADATPQERVRMSPALPDVPDSISDLTAAVLPSGEGSQLFSPLDECSLRCHNGTDFRNAYTAPRVAPSTGHDANGPLTIATLQFAGWNPQDLTAYAKSIHLPDPVASGQFTGIPVDEPHNRVPGAPKRGSFDAEADEEVDLDQETILSTDPSANQRAYFSPNRSMRSYVQDLSQVLADVTQGTGAYQGGDPNIVALSTSWGTCEDFFQAGFAKETIGAVENVLKSLTAAGVTVFAASGDDGIYDCGDPGRPTKIAVDYPASSPEVVGVGGTRLSAIGARTANNGSNWTDTAWRCTSAEICEGAQRGDTGGSGGGESDRFALPSYQSVALGLRKFTTSTGKTGAFGTQPHRLVPDIADDGDPASGFGVLTTDPTDVRSCVTPTSPTCKPERFAIGGTSLSSPEAASLFTDMLAAHRVTAGVGDIHDALYSAYAAHHGAFRDVTSGGNGHQHDVDLHATLGLSAEFPVNSQKGYDTVTGLGAPLWPRIAPFIFAPAVPSASGAVRLASPHSPTHATTVTATWSAQQAAKGGIVASSAAITITRKGTKTPVYTVRSAPAAGSHTFIAHHGGTYLLSVTARDLAGKTSATITKWLVVPFDDRSFAFHGTWSRINGRTDYAGSHAVTDAAGAYAKATARGRRYVLKVRTGPAYGTVEIDHGSTTIGSYDLYSPTIRHLRIVFFGSPTTPVATRTFTFRYTGRKNPQSTSPTVDLDALSVSR
jgi:Subtilase family